MKRVLALLIALIVVFTACTEAENSSSIPSGETSAPVTAPERDYVKENIALYNRDKLFSGEKRTNMNNAMITPVVTSAYKDSDTTATVVVDFKSDNAFLSLSAKCDIYWLGNGSFEEYCTVSGFNADVQQEKLIVTLNDKAMIYSAKDFTPLLTILPSDEGRKLIDTTAYKDGWISAFVSENGQGFEIYDKNGKFIEEYVFKKALFTRPTPQNYNSTLAVNPRPHITFIDKEQTLLIYSADKETYSKGNDIPHYLFNLSKGAVTRYQTIEYWNFHPYNNSNSYHLLSVENGQDTDSDSLIIYSVKDSKPDRLQKLNINNLPQNFADKEIKHRSPAFYDHSITLYCTASGCMVTVDMNTGEIYTLPKGTVDKYKLYSHHEVSADGKYSIFAGDSHGGGDVSYSKYYLVENATGKLKYLDELGGMYGGKEDTGFLQNSDVYTYTYDNFVIFGTDMDNPQPIWRLTNHFPMGENAAEGVYCRYLMAARRDPVSKSVLIIYFDDTYGDDRYEEGFIDYKNNGWQLKATYKVALINPDGTIGYVHDTGVNVLAGWGLHPVSMYLESPTSLRIYSWANSHRYTYFEGRLNLTTGEYRSIKDFDISEYH